MHFFFLLKHLYFYFFFNTKYLFYLTQQSSLFWGVYIEAEVWFKECKPDLRYVNDEWSYTLSVRESVFKEGQGLALWKVVKVDFIRVLAHCEWGAGESGDNNHKRAAEDTSWIVWGFAVLENWYYYDLILHYDKISKKCFWFTRQFS